MMMPLSQGFAIEIALDYIDRVHSVIVEVGHKGSSGLDSQ